MPLQNGDCVGGNELCSGQCRFGEDLMRANWSEPTIFNGAYSICKPQSSSPFDKGNVNVKKYCTKKTTFVYV